MPQVGSKKFPYTASGIKAAEAAKALKKGFVKPMPSMKKPSPMKPFMDKIGPKKKMPSFERMIKNRIMSK